MTASLKACRANENLVLGRRELLGQLHHGLVRLEIGIRLGKGEEPAEHTAQACFSACEPLHGLGVSWVGGRPGAGAFGRIAGSDDGFEGLAFMGEEPLGGFDQVWNQVMAPLQLHVDLGECVPKTVPKVDQAVVDAREPGDQRDSNHQQSNEPHHGVLPCLQKALSV